MAKFQSTKTYGNDRGLSCCFRQWKANHSHCSTLHGYSLGFKFVWESATLDEKNWVFDFGGMKPIKAWLDYMFDHTILVAEDDPALDVFKTLAAFSTKDEWNGVEDHVGFMEPKPYELGRVAALRIVPGVGCEMTAKLVYDKSVELLEQMKTGENSRYAINPDVRLVSVECFEHGSNSAVYYGPTTERKTIYVDVGDMKANEAEAYLEKVRGEINQRNAPQVNNVSEATSDFADKMLEYIRAGQTIKSSSIPNVGSALALAEAALRAVGKAEKPAKQLEQVKEGDFSLEDLEFFTKNLLSALRVPPVK